jgi:hypothetical protein
VSSGRRILWIVGSVFRLAIKRGQYSKNPVASVERAVQPARELGPDEPTFGFGTDAIDPDSVLNPKEIQTLLREANPGYERTLFETAYLTGAREGELLALRWTYLELPKEGAGKMVVRRSLSWARGSSPALLPAEDQSRPANDLSPRSAGRGAQALEDSVPNLGRRSGIPDQRREAHGSGQDAPDPILPGPFAGEASTRYVSHATPQFCFGHDREWRSDYRSAASARPREPRDHAARVLAFPETRRERRRRSAGRRPVELPVSVENRERDRIRSLSRPPR